MSSLWMSSVPQVRNQTPREPQGDAGLETGSLEECEDPLGGPVHHGSSRVEPARDLGVWGEGCSAIPSQEPVTSRRRLKKEIGAFLMRGGRVGTPTAGLRLGWGEGVESPLPD